LTEKGPQSIVKICKDNGLKSCFGVSPNLLTFPEAQTNLAKEGVEFFFGLELWVCNEPDSLTPQSQLSESKVIIRADNSQGYFDLKAIYSKVYTNRANFYHRHRSSFAEIKALWTSNLTLILPFFDSFVCQNTLTVASIVPDLPVPPLIFREVDSGLPFAPLIDAALDQFNADKKYPEQRVKTVFYPTKAHFRAWQVLRCIKERSSYQKPELPYCCSDNFSFENYLRLKEDAL
jgi:DNA polymerase III alpha subunit